MGDPKRQRKKHRTPRHPWRSDILEAELKLVGTYGLRNKRELWRLKTMVSNIRRNARLLLSESPEERGVAEKQLLGKLYRLGVLPEDATLDDVLNLTVEDLLERRLQTVVFRKGLAKTIHQARQFIVHGHIAIGGRRVRSPGYLVRRDEEELIGFSPRSPLAQVMKSGGESR